MSTTAKKEPALKATQKEALQTVATGGKAGVSRRLLHFRVRELFLRLGYITEKKDNLVITAKGTKALG